MMPFSDDRRRHLKFYHSSWSSSREWSFAFCIGKARRREISRPGFWHSLEIPLTTCEVSSVDIYMFDMGASFWMMKPSLEGRQLIFLIFRFCLHLTNYLFTRPTHFSRSSMCRTRQSWTICATRFTWNISICGGFSTSWSSISEPQESRNARSYCHC
jgi:hypothetical protein